MKTRQNPLAAWAAIALLFLATLPMTGCPAQTTLAALTNTLGTAAASIATLEGNTALAAKLQADTAAAATAIQNWKSGTNAQMAVEAINIVIDDLNLICPVGGICGPYGPLIVLALGTAQSIIAILNPTATPNAAKVGPNARVNLGHPAPKTAAEFKAQWNGIAQSDPALASLVLK